MENSICPYYPTSQRPPSHSHVRRLARDPSPFPNRTPSPRRRNSCPLWNATSTAPSCRASPSSPASCPCCAICCVSSSPTASAMASVSCSPGTWSVSSPPSPCGPSNGTSTCICCANASAFPVYRLDLQRRSFLCPVLVLLFLSPFPASLSPSGGLCLWIFCLCREICGYRLST